MNKVIEGNILDVNGVIIHQLNNCGLANAGVAKDIRGKAPHHYEDIVFHYNKVSSNCEEYFYYRQAKPEQLGDLVMSKGIGNVKGIIGMIAQHGLGRGVLRTNYNAFERCLTSIAEIKAKRPHLDFYMPYNIGCVNAGGQWSIVSKLIEEICPFIILVKYKN